MLVIVCLSTLILFHLTLANPSLQCGDWDAFKDETCFKVFDNKELQSFSDAKSTCNQYNGSSLVMVRSSEEQDFLFSLLRDVHKTVNDVWIGAEYKENQLKWYDNVTVNYTNWANGYPVNQSGYECVKIVLDEPSHGKWFNTLCDKNNVVVCEMSQNWLYSYLQTTVMELRKSMDNMALELESTKSHLKSTEAEMARNKGEFDQTKTQMQAELNSTKSQMASNKIEFEQTKTQLQAEIIKSAAQSTPPGTVAYFANITVPFGWLKANGQSVSRTAYANLFATISTRFGSGDGSTTFTLPDLRGEFIRGWSDGRDVDKDRSFGSFQWGSSIPFAGHIVDGKDVVVNPAYDLWSFTAHLYDEGFESYVSSGETRSGMTFPNDGNNLVFYLTGPNTVRINKWHVMKGTRPRNIALMACIKY